MSVWGKGNIVRRVSNWMASLSANITEKSVISSRTFPSETYVYFDQVMLNYIGMEAYVTVINKI